MKWLAYSWRTAVNLLSLVIVCLVLESINNPMEKSIIAVLGLIYATIRAIAISNGIAFMDVGAALQKQLDAIQYRVDGTFEPPDRTEDYKTAEKTKVKLYIDSGFVSLTAIACLWFFFAAH